MTKSKIERSKHQSYAYLSDADKDKPAGLRLQKYAHRCRCCTSSLPAGTPMVCSYCQERPDVKKEIAKMYKILERKPKKEYIIQGIIDAYNEERTITDISRSFNCSTGFVYLHLRKRGILIRRRYSWPKRDEMKLRGYRNKYGKDYLEKFLEDMPNYDRIQVKNKACRMGIVHNFLTYKEKKYIDDNCDKMSVASMSRELKRSPGPIHSYMAEMHKIPMKSGYDATEIAEMLGKHPDTLRRFIKSGIIEAKKSLSGSYEIPPTEVKKFLCENPTEWTLKNISKPFMIKLLKAS